MATKQRRTVATAALVAAGVFLVLAGANAIADGPSKDKAAAATAAPSPNGKPGIRSFKRVSTVPSAQASRCSLSCVNRKLKRLTKEHNKLVTAHNNLVRDYIKCEKTVNVTQYPGYDYNGVIGATTALDFTEPGSSVSERMLVYVC